MNLLMCVIAKWRMAWGAPPWDGVNKDGDLDITFSRAIREDTHIGEIRGMRLGLWATNTVMWKVP